MVIAYDIIGNGLLSIPGDDPDDFIRFKQVDEICKYIFNASKLNFAWYVPTFGPAILWTSHKINRQGKNKIDMFFYAKIDLAVLHESEDYQEDVIDMLTAVVGRAEQWESATAFAKPGEFPGEFDASQYTVSVDDTTKDATETNSAALAEAAVSADTSGSASTDALTDASADTSAVVPAEHNKRHKTGGKNRVVTKDEPELRKRKKTEAEMETNLKQKIENEWKEKLSAVEEEAKQKLQEVEEQAQQKLQETEKEAQKKIQEAELKHSRYKKTISTERKQWAQEQRVTKCALENEERLKKEALDAANVVEKKYTEVLNASASGASITKKNPKEFYEMLIHRFLNMYNMRMTATTAVPQKTLESNARYQFEDNGSVWTDICATDICDLLDTLTCDQSSPVTYSSGSNKYSSVMVNIADPHCDNGSFIEQTNIGTGIVRRIRKPGYLTQSAIDDATRIDTLFGNAKMTVNIAEVNMWMSEYNLTEGVMVSSEPSVLLAQLAEAFSSFGSGFKYTGAKKCATELFIKPLQLYQWLKYASCRGYTHMRIVLHGGNKEEYKAVKADPFGFNLRHAGKNGSAKGPGIYFGTSDHISCSYNTDGKDGTGILGIILCEERWDLHVGSMTPYNLPPRPNSNNPAAYEHTQGQFNAICVGEMGLILPLGKVVAV